MRILFITNYYPPYEVGGYEQLCRDVATRLADRGHTVHILTSDWGVRGNSQPAEPGIDRVLRLQPDLASRLSPALQFFLTRRQAKALNHRRFRQVAAQFAPDVIFVWNLERLPHSLAVEAEAMPNVTVAYWLAGCSPVEPDAFWRYWNQPPAVRHVTAPLKWVIRQLAVSIMRREMQHGRPQMRHVAVVSEYMRRKGIEEGTLPPHARVIYNGVEIEQFHRPVPVQSDGQLRLLQAGRISADKGVHVAVEAVGCLVREFHVPGVHLTIAGSGPDEYLARLRRLVHEYDIQDHVTFLGWLPREEMPALMARCHVLLLPTVNQEPFARVVLEAMASGLTVVGALTGGTGELLQHEITGLAAAAGDYQDLARQIHRLAADLEFRQRLAIGGQKLVLDRFKMSRMVDHVELFLEQACAGEPMGQPA